MVGGSAARRSRHQDGDVDLAIRIVGVAATVSAEQSGAYAGDLKETADDAGRSQVGHQEIPLGIDVGRDVMGDLSRIVAQPDASVESCRTEPDRSTVITLFEGLPEPNVIPPVCTFPCRLLERVLLLLSQIVERADRRVAIRSIQYHTPDDLDA